MIKGERVALRLLTEADLDTYSNYVNNINEIGQYWPSYIRSKVNIINEFHRDGMSNNQNKIMAVVNQQDEIVGEVGIHKWSTEIIGDSISYRIFHQHNQSKGYMTEAVQLLTSWLFDVSPAVRLTIITAEENAASRKVAEKCGFRAEGVLRTGLFSRGEYRNAVIYGLLRADHAQIRLPGANHH